MTELEEFRKQKNVFLATDRHSPFTAGQRKDFKGLEYFPENPDLRLEVASDAYEHMMSGKGAFSGRSHYEEELKHSIEFIYEFVQRNLPIDGVAPVPGGRYPIHRPLRVVLVAPRCTAQRFGSESLQPVRVTLGDGPSL
jgi:hypothetical protein